METFFKTDGILTTKEIADNLTVASRKMATAINALCDSITMEPETKEVQTRMEHLRHSLRLLEIACDRCAQLCDLKREVFLKS